MMLLVFLITACGNNDKEQAAKPVLSAKTGDYEAAAQGKEMFYDRNFGSTAMACADCHADYDERYDSTGIIRAGNPVLGAARRRTAWNGEIRGPAMERTAAGAARCAVFYLRKGKTAKEALTAEEARSLLAYFRYISNGSDPVENPWTAVTYPGNPKFNKEWFVAYVDSLNKLKGDPEHGAVLFGRACSVCHSLDRGLSSPAPMLRRFAPKLVAYVRAGNNTMPFFSRARLSDQDVVDIREFIQRSGRVAVQKPAPASVERKTIAP